MKKSVIAKGYKTRAGAARAVFSGRKMKTVGGLTKDKLTKSKSGKIVSKKQQAQGKKAYGKYLAKWTKAVQAEIRSRGWPGRGVSEEPLHFPGPDGGYPRSLFYTLDFLFCTPNCV